MPDPQPVPKKGLARFWELSLEQKVFSGLVGTLLAALVAAAVAFFVTKGQDQGSAQSVAERTGSGSAIAPPGEGGGTSGGPVDEDEDGVPDAADECLGEPGPQPSGCPIADRDTSLGDFIEAGELETSATENTTYGENTVDGVTDLLGIRMELDDEFRSGTLTIPTQGAFQAIHGQVGITAQPCSAGSVAEVAIRDEEGKALWPKSGRLQPVSRKPLKFDVPIGGEDFVVLYASAPVAEEGRCGILDDETIVGWVQNKLSAP